MSGTSHPLRVVGDCIVLNLRRPFHRQVPIAAVELNRYDVIRRHAGGTAESTPCSMAPLIVDNLSALCAGWVRGLRLLLDCLIAVTA